MYKRKDRKSLKTTNVYKTLKSDYELRRLLNHIIQPRKEDEPRLRHIPNVLIASIGAVTNSSRPANMQILYSTDLQTERLFGTPFPMERGLTNIHYNMLMLGPDNYEMFTPDQLFSKKIKEWYTKNEIKLSLVYSIGVCHIDLNGRNAQAHLVLYLNYDKSKIQDHENYLLSLDYLIEIRKLFQEDLEIPLIVK